MTVRRARGILPGFGLSLGTSVLYLTLLVLVPLAGVALRGATARWDDVWRATTSARALASFRLSFSASIAAGAANAAAGLLIAWVLVRYRFAGRSALDALVDVPFALPTAVAGLALTAVYSADGWVGRWLAPLGIKVVYTPIGVWLAMSFVGLPFVVRTVQPVLAGIDAHLEEAAAVLGASRLQAFGRVVMPTVLPAVLTGFTLAVARALGEYGSIVFISGNLPLRTEIAPLLIIAQLEQYDYAGATALALVLLLASFALLLATNVLQRWSVRRLGPSPG
jgi:sulfate/thiosulfate transport system permease protein